jgi:hypothetical protein
VASMIIITPPRTSCLVLTRNISEAMLSCLSMASELELVSGAFASQKAWMVTKERSCWEYPPRESVLFYFVWTSRYATYTELPQKCIQEDVCLSRPNHCCWKVHWHHVVSLPALLLFPEHNLPSFVMRMRCNDCALFCIFRLMCHLIFRVFYYSLKLLASVTGCIISATFRRTGCRLVKFSRGKIECPSSDAFVCREICRDCFTLC